MSIGRLLRSLIWLLCLSYGTAKAQCFPDSSASWCFISADNSESVNTHMVMGPQPDTLILGQTYKRIDEYNDALGFETWQFVKHFYVRSEPNGKGYVMLLNSMQEYLEADVSALAGDTVRDVLTVFSWGFDQEYWLKSVIVDSVRTFTNNGVSVVRQFVHAHGWAASYPASHEIFWQAGIGGSYGPILILTVAGAFQELQCLRVQDTYVYTGQFSYPGLPGIPCDCPLDSPLGLVDHPVAGVLRASPNPSPGLFNIICKAPGTTHVFDAQGHELFNTHGKEVDLSTYPPGIYTAVMDTPQVRQAVRLVVLR